MSFICFGFLSSIVYTLFSMIMKYLDEYRDADVVKKLAKNIQEITTKPWTIMEVCGGQTHSIVKFGLDQLLPENVTLVHGPGCPVCVTPVEAIDKAVYIASQPNVILCSFGDMLRVPGTKKDLLTVKAEGGDIRIVYSPTDTIKIAQENPNKQIVFFAVGFETTAPGNAMTVYQAKKLGITNSLVSKDKAQWDKSIPELENSEYCLAKKQDGQCMDCRKCWNPEQQLITYLKH